MIILSGCGISLSGPKICQENPALLDYLTPHLAGWATNPATFSKEMERELAKDFADYFSVNIWSGMTTDNRETIVVEIAMERWHDWQCGYLYVH